MTPTDPDNNRSSALSAEAIGAINMATQAAVQSTIEALMKGLIPVFKDMAITPEKLREANRPYEDPKKKLREERESAKSKQDEKELQELTAARRANCPHLDKNGRSSIDLVHNMPDHQPRGVCVVCGDWIHPREWRIGASDSQNPRGRAYLVEPHKDYRVVLQLESMS